MFRLGFRSLADAGVYLAVAGLMLLMGFFGRRMPGPARLQRNEAAVVVSLVFITSSLAMALPIMTYAVGFLDAWLESVSGITTTGLSTLDTTDMPDSMLFARGWSQWVGGSRAHARRVIFMACLPAWRP